MSGLKTPVPQEEQPRGLYCREHYLPEGIGSADVQHTSFSRLFTISLNFIKQVFYDLYAFNGTHYKVKNWNFSSFPPHTFTEYVTA